ncbi:MAG TPA: Hint domain-containing protein [Acidisoma sp.]|uniref:Hint domain-containing protein n=1 Tax=Acidisoma sp. TaxID=1872115 RepID=UPI002B6E74D1|nr:Hint domain-containing protein [Acidisoma sp.]HTI02912.1 Hint domain-containing protein [Acidisoma sp.]
MSGTISTTVTQGVTLSVSPTTITSGGAVIAASGDAVTGTTAGAPVSGWTVVNQGSVTASAAGANGIDLSTAGSISNAGVIAGYRNGIDVTGGAASVTNSGVIDSSPTKIVSGSPNYVYDGIYLGAGGSVTNTAQGTIFGSIGGIDIANATGTVTNTGLIYTTTLQGNGVALENGGIINNAGTTGIYGDFSGVSVYGGAGVITNSAVIDAVGLNGYGVYLGAGGTITNTASGSVIGTYDGIDVGAGTATVTNAGYIYGYDLGVGLYGGGIITNLAGGVIASVTTGVAVDGGTVVNAGTIDGTATGKAVVFGTGLTNRLVVEQGASFVGSVTGGGGGSVLELGAATSGTLTGLGGQVTGFNTIVFDSGDSWSLAGSFSAFSGETISGFDHDDKLVLNGVTGVSSSVSGSTLTLVSNGTTESMNFGTIAGTLQVQAVGSNTVVTLACFRSGTEIRTPDGSRSIECLREGDLVTTVCGESLPVIWVGQQRIDCTVHERPTEIQPILVEAGAFAPAVPARDLYLSPDHAILARGVLIPVKYLVNDMTVRQVAVEMVTYHHIELPRHAAIFAEGLAAESYMDVGDRPELGLGRDFAGQDRPDLQLLRDALACAPIRVLGPEIEQVRARLAARAAAVSARDGGANRAA